MATFFSITGKVFLLVLNPGLCFSTAVKVGKNYRFQNRKGSLSSLQGLWIQLQSLEANSFSIYQIKLHLTQMTFQSVNFRPYNFYVFHVDRRQSNVRQELFQRLRRKFVSVGGPSSNIAILSQERSFATSWGSTDILRAG